MSTTKLYYGSIIYSRSHIIISEGTYICTEVLHAHVHDTRPKPAESEASFTGYKLKVPEANRGNVYTNIFRLFRSILLGQWPKINDIVGRGDENY